MAVTLSIATLASALRLGNSRLEHLEAKRLLAYASEAVTRHAPDAPDVVHDEAAIRVAAYLFDQPTSPSGSGWSNSMRHSGAERLLLPYVQHGAGAVSETSDADA